MKSLPTRRPAVQRPKTFHAAPMVSSHPDRRRPRSGAAVLARALFGRVRLDVAHGALVAEIVRTGTLQGRRRPEGHRLAEALEIAARMKSHDRLRERTTTKRNSRGR
jgi:hypothetical protein